MCMVSFLVYHSVGGFRISISFSDGWISISISISIDDDDDDDDDERGTHGKRTTTGRSTDAFVDSSVVSSKGRRVFLGWFYIWID